MFHFHKCPNHQITKKTTYPSRNGPVQTHVIWGTCVEHVKVSSEIVVMDPDPYHDVVGCNWLKKMFIFTFKTDLQGTIMRADPLVKSLPLLQTQAYFQSSLLSLQKVTSANPSRSTFFWRRTLLANHSLALKNQELTRKNSRKIVSFRVERSDDQKYVCVRRLLLSNRIILTKNISRLHT